MKDTILSVAALGLVILASSSFSWNGEPKSDYKNFALLQQDFNIHDVNNIMVDSPVLPKPDTVPAPVPVPSPDTIPSK